ncbi:MAG: NAD(P)/FAD-dependent oxidoreductase [Candidatus Omnitrophica bacterium]|nr:NAD(P)/FAD-dependent oxidoreductase [Candidatus Omnitrophota bacterium]MDD5553099.1 NAD(P)/FAD-dependent oxidoreductase [Candidatus Omnitrophota bacterium]
MGKLNFKYDVVIIGGGPVGIYTSIKLAKEGLRVLVIEEDAQIGKPRFCTGLISRESFERFSLPKEAIEKEFNCASVFSPLGSKASLKSKSIQAYVTDRTKFDFSLYNMAKEAGVEFFLSCHCRGLKVYSDRVEAAVSYDQGDTTVRSEAAVLSTGIKYNLHRSLGFSVPGNFLDCSQVQLAGESGSEIEIFLGNSIAPHSFGWVVPLEKKRLRVGISTRKNSPVFLRSFLKHLKLKDSITLGRYFTDIMRRPIPLEPIKQTYADRMLVVGDAAGQVKPTTGGGIYFGLLCADLAAQTLAKAFKKGDFSGKFLSHYETNWKKQIEFDLTMSIYLRKLIARFNDEQIEELVKFISQDNVQQLMEKYADFNHHGRFIKELIKMPLFWKHLYHMVNVK